MSIELTYEFNGSLRPMPGWANWLRDLGTLAVACAAALEKHTFVVTLPSRSYAAAMVLLGVAEASYERQPDKHLHWKTLQALPPGTWVRHLDRGRYYTCSQIEHVFVRGEDVWLQLTGGLAKRWDMCADVQPLAEGEEPFNQRHAPREHGLLRSVLPHVDSRAYCASGTPLAMAVCSKALLLEELATTRIAAEGCDEAGTLQDVVRARLQSGSPYRCDVVPAAGEELPARAGDRVPVVVLDGAASALRWRHRVDSGAAVVVLDRTAASFEAAIEALLADRARSLEDVQADVLRNRPAGVEALGFKERR